MYHVTGTSGARRTPAAASLSRAFQAASFVSLVRLLQTRVAIVIMSKTGVALTLFIPELPPPHNVSHPLPCILSVLISEFFSPMSIHTSRQVTSGGESVLLALTGPPREGCGLGLRPANGSGALANTMGP